MSTDGAGAAAGITRTLELPFAVLSDPTGERAIKPLGVWHEDERRARPALIVLAPHGREVFRHVGSDQADRDREPEALAAVRALGLQPRSAPQGVREHGEPRPTEKAFPRDQLGRHFYGVRSGSNVLHLRTGHEQAARLRDMAERYLEVL